MNTNDLAETAQELQSQAQEATQEWRTRAMETARSAGEVTDRYVHENVWTTVAVAALGGIVLGFLLGRTHD